LSHDQLYPRDESGYPAMTEHEALRKLKRLERDGVTLSPQIALLQPLITISDSETRSARDWLLSRRKNPTARLVALAPGCNIRAQAWPLANFAELGLKLMALEEIEILVLGGINEKSIGDELVDRWKSGINAAGQFSVMQSAALLSLCDIFIGLSSGTTHLAAAVDVPCFAIYGKRDNPGQWVPLGSGHMVISHKVACAGCRFFDCPLPTHPCMTEITVEKAWDGLQSFMAGNFNRSRERCEY
jgi:ADP-heptose:LPS heptosyltransferase